MQLIRRGALLSFVLMLTAMQLVTGALAQDSATPSTGTPTSGTPVAVEGQLDGRLGGSLASFTDLYGQPDFTGVGLVRYDSVEIDGMSTILVVYYDEAETVTRVALVYAVQPDGLSTPDQILAAAATVAPPDGECQSEAIASGFGSEVYPCHSRALMTIFSAEQMEALLVSGGLGEYSVSVNPLPDAYFELIVQPGTDGTSLVPTAAPGELTATPTPTLAEQYPELTDPTALMNGDIPLKETLSFTGDILTLQVAAFGKQFRLGEDESLGVSSLFQVEVPAQGSSDTAVLFVGYNGDSTGLAIGDTITVYGANYGTQCFDNALGDEICQPLIAADLVEK
jgi:hypothetical protein